MLVDACQASSCTAQNVVWASRSRQQGIIDNTDKALLIINTLVLLLGKTLLAIVGICWCNKRHPDNVTGLLHSQQYM